LLGADEFGFGTAALLALGCVMARQCHLNICPVGIATQDEKLRTRFTGKPEMVESYFRAVAGEVRSLLAAMGACSIDAVVGVVDRLQPRDKEAERVLAELLEPIVTPQQTACRREPAGALQLALSRTSEKRPSGRSHRFRITNADRAVGARLSGEILRQRSGVTTPLDFDFIGTAGQSFGAFSISGIHLRLYGEANDYVGKGLSGGNISITAGEEASLRGDVLAGNTVLYGATSGELYIAGRAGERFAVRNSGALAVVEGVGQHGCEYMTAGIAVILGSAGINLGAGMTGGLVYLLRNSSAGQVHNHQSVRIVSLELKEELWLRRVLQRHQQLTRSPQTAQLLRSERPLPFDRVEPLSLPCSVAETWSAILTRFGRHKAPACDVSRVVPLDGLPSYRKRRAFMGNR
jgi:glutamate synthase (ferredoxin)